LSALPEPQRGGRERAQGKRSATLGQCRPIEGPLNWGQGGGFHRHVPARPDLPAPNFGKLAPPCRNPALRVACFGLSPGRLSEAQEAPHRGRIVSFGTTKQSPALRSYPPHHDPTPAAFVGPRMHLGRLPLRLSLLLPFHRAFSIGLCISRGFRGSFGRTKKHRPSRTGAIPINLTKKRFRRTSGSRRAR